MPADPRLSLEVSNGFENWHDSKKANEDERHTLDQRGRALARLSTIVEGGLEVTLGGSCVLPPMTLSDDLIGPITLSPIGKVAVVGCTVYQPSDDNLRALGSSITSSLTLGSLGCQSEALKPLAFTLQINPQTQLNINYNDSCTAKKAAPGTKYRKRNHLVDGPEKVYDCQEKPNGPNCADPQYNHSITDKVVNDFCPNCKAEGRS
ncbi:uncharacterized protein BDR25DRAFT_361716 [Lindgomyces ingoldianus]|uniref:Uncharacterized protein n=1 Tax=Lindgomyces ingoldianus TaxID=673940 RepID=A0ACB6QBC9_9PLEO|nr:uncharacterized protein BDR25DRAFT_361716 [Lindgomyces ingoldianus]KAF2464201.1 hypothetical protein BDR25DRAFT_361716 [Lindgomyces ingoldianus]